MNKIEEYFHLLFAYYGKQYWWPNKSDSRWEIIAGAILTQNTSWTNVEKALANLFAKKMMTPEKILTVKEEELQPLIAPAGFFRQKSSYLKIMAEFILKNEYKFLAGTEINILRKELLSLKGVGRETADSILLYAYGKPIFVIDAYTRRFGARHLGTPEKMPYDDLQKLFMDSLKKDPLLFNEYHALIVRLCKESCLKKGCGNLCKELFGK